ncbi:MAG: DegT/DnrJ/EryC1/StrS aminotransferase family protein [bacterium]|nr:DegT/DnrJ/EryC1/StrS aminotransferase family protein [bacterium]
MKIVSTKPTITRKELEGVLDRLINNELITGGPVKNLEGNFSSLCELKYSLATNSVTSAYHLIFHSLQLDNTSEVIIPSFMGQAPLSALSALGAKPVLVDNDENSLFPSIDAIKEKITENTRAIVINHTFGFHFDIDTLEEIKIPIIEDISHAVGTENNEVPVGKKSTFTVISFAPSMIITTGNGGMVLTNNSKYYSSMRDMRGSRPDQLSMDYTMTDIQAAMGISQLSKLKDFIKRRRNIAKVYSDALKITPHKALIPYSEQFSYQSFPVIFDTPSDKAIKYWKKNGVEIVNPVEFPLHVLMGERGVNFPNTDRLSKKIFTIPLYPTLTKKEIEKISRTLSSFI